MKRLLQACGWLVLIPLLQGHVGSPDIYLDAQAGPYKLFVTVRPPTVIPGVAELEVRTDNGDVREIRAVPVPLTKAGAQLAPVADVLKRSPQDAQFFTGALWMMASGSWQVRLHVTGTQGMADIAIPVPAVALTTKPMRSGMALGLGALMLILVGGLVLIVGAAVRESRLPAGAQPDAAQQRRGRRAMTLTLGLLVAVLALGRLWWGNSEDAYRQKVYKPLAMKAAVTSSGVLTLKVTNPAWMNGPFRKGSQNGAPLFTRVLDDFVPDHQHLMHLYAIRQPGFDALYHLHPELVQTGVFRLTMPAMEPGPYRLYADVVHANGFGETMTASVDVPAGLPVRALSGDDAAGRAAAWQTAPDTTAFRLPDGYSMVWDRAAGPLRAKMGMPFRFRLMDASGRPARDVGFYMGMLGHAAFVKTDGTTFAHVHPTGSVAMASYLMAQNQLHQQQAPQMASMDPGMNMDDMNMSGMAMGMHGMAVHQAGATGAIPNEVLFPYGFPSPGRYRIFVQMKHGSTVETGAFDALVH